MKHASLLFLLFALIVSQSIGATIPLLERIAEVRAQLTNNKVSLVDAEVASGRLNEKLNSIQSSDQGRQFTRLSKRNRQNLQSILHQYEDARSSFQDTERKLARLLNRPSQGAVAETLSASEQFEVLVLLHILRSEISLFRGLLDQAGTGFVEGNSMIHCEMISENRLLPKWIVLEYHDSCPSDAVSDLDLTMGKLELAVEVFLLPWTRQSDRATPSVNLNFGEQLS